MAPMTEADARTNMRSSVDGRGGVDTRSVEEQRLVGDRRSGIDRRSASVSSVEELARQVQKAQGLEQKLDLLARMTLEIASALSAIERRIRVIQRNTADQNY
jgi:hypothetical protein